MHLNEFRVRLQALLALKAAAEGAHPRPNLFEPASQVVELSNRLAPPAAEQYKAWGELLRCLAHVLRWRVAILDAEVDADRHLRAAQQRAQSVLAALQPLHGRLRDAAQHVASITAPENVPDAMASLIRVPLPLPFVEERRGASPLQAARESQAPQASPVLAFLQFFIGGAPVEETHDIKANVLYDLTVEVRLSSPLPCAIEITPYVVEPEGIVDAPTFLLPLADGPRSSTGRLLVRTAHDSLARPLEVSFGAAAIPGTQDEKVELRVQGQHRFRLRCVDEFRRWSGNQAIEDAIGEACGIARSLGLQDSEIAAFLELLGSVAFIAADALASNAFRGAWPEESFHAEARRRLRQDPAIGSDLEDHPHIGGGIADLSFRRVRLELKAVSRPLTLQMAFELHGQQLVQYVVGSDRRCGVLAVLCEVEAGHAPAALQNDIGCLVVPPPGGGSYPVLLGIVLVRSNLPAPSSLSRA